MRTEGSQPEEAERIAFWQPPDLPGVRGLSVWSSFHRWSLFHEAYALTVVHDGSGEWAYRRRLRGIEPASVMLIEPDNVHVTTAVGRAATFDTLFIDPGLVRGLAERWGLSRGAPHFAALDNRRPDVVAAFARVVRSLRSQREPVDRAALFEDALHRLFEHAGEAAPPPVKAPRASVRKARDLIYEACISDDGKRGNKIGAVAAAVGLTPIQLTRGFSQVFGLTPSQFQIRIRLSRSLALIARGPTDELRSLADIAVEAGFFDLSHMNKAFRRVVRMAPSAYAGDVGTARRWAGAGRGRA
jgi:AraC-like DNA-binding protein